MPVPRHLSAPGLTAGAVRVPVGGRDAGEGRGQSRNLRCRFSRRQPRRFKRGARGSAITQRPGDDHGGTGGARDFAIQPDRGAIRDGAVDTRVHGDRGIVVDGEGRGRDGNGTIDGIPSSIQQWSALPMSTVSPPGSASVSTFAVNEKVAVPLVAFAGKVSLVSGTAV